MNIKHVLERHPLLSYFVIVFAVAWGGILLVLGPSGLQPAATRAMQMVVLVFLAMLLGPSLTGTTLTAILDGKPGLKELFSRWRRWRVAWRWYAVALLTTPLVLLLIAALLSIVSPVFMPALLANSDTATVLGFGLTIGLLAGFFEEIGWTGFALPRMLARQGVLATGLALGVLWGTWHLLGDYWGNAGAYGLLYLIRAFLWVATLTAYRVLMVHVYHKTTSLVLMQLMHASFTGGQAILGPTLSPANYLLWYSTFSAVLWGLVAIIALREQRIARTLQPQTSKSYLRET
jgi:membrane protease YdiL (CAAX protease family)